MVTLGPWRGHLLHEIGPLAVYHARDGEREAVIHLARDPTAALDAPSFVRGLEALRTIPEAWPIARLLDGDATASTRWTATEYFPGRTWARLFSSGKPFDPLIMALEALEIVRLLEEAHALDLVHGSFGPESVRLTDEGQLKLIDFGLATLFRASTASDPRYRAPEHHRIPSACDARTDVYGVGVTLFQLLTVRPPYGGIDAGALWPCILSQPLCPDTTPIPAPLRTLIQRATAKDPAKRFPHMRELRNALIEALAELAAEAPNDARLDIESGERAVRTTDPDAAPPTVRSPRLEDTLTAEAVPRGRSPGATVPSAPPAAPPPTEATAEPAGPPAAGNLTESPAPPPEPLASGSAPRRPRVPASTWIAVALALVLATELARNLAAPAPAPTLARTFAAPARVAPAPLAAEPAPADSAPPPPIPAASPPSSRSGRRGSGATLEPSPVPPLPSALPSGTPQKFPWEIDDPCAISWYRCGR